MTPMTSAVVTSVLEGGRHRIREQFFCASWTMDDYEIRQGLPSEVKDFQLSLKAMIRTVYLRWT